MAAGIVLLLSWLTLKWLPNEEKAIRRTMIGLVQSASINPNESGFARLSYADRLAAFFTTNATLSLEGLGSDFPTINGRTDLLQAAMAARANLRQASFELADLHVSLQRDRRTASAYMAVRGYTNFETNRFGQAFRTTLMKVNGRWLIHELSAVERQ